MSEEICCSKTEGFSIITKYGLHESTLGYLHGAEKQYRDSRPTNSLHVREFPTKFCMHLDKHNPEIQPVEHFFEDVLKPEAVIAGLVTYPVALAFTKKPKSAFWWSLGITTLVQILIDNIGESKENDRRTTAR
jgi:hypothetical protein